MNTAKSARLARKLRGVGTAIIGAVALGAAALDFDSTREFVTSARKTEGFVLSLNAGPAHPQVEFRASNGKVITFPGNGCVSHQPGDRVRVLYRDGQPLETATLDEPGALWVFDGITALTGVVLMLTGGNLLARPPKEWRG
jgi:hypothetical protein